jgi:DNA topoisomerase IB
MQLKKLDKSLCKLSKEQLATILPEFAAELDNCRFVCRKCMRVAPTKKILCKPLSLKKILAAEEESLVANASQCIQLAHEPLDDSQIP